MKATPEQIAAVRAIYENDDIRIDDDALTDTTLDGFGAWVSAWVYLPFPDENNGERPARYQEERNDLVR